MKTAEIWVRVCHCGDIPLREGRTVSIGDHKIAVFNLGTRFLAVENRCPHRGGPLAEGIVSGTSIVCPLHAWKFSLENGKGVSSTSQDSCVATFPTRIEDGIVLLQLDSQAHGHEQTSRVRLTNPASCDWNYSTAVRAVE